MPGRPIPERSQTGRDIEAASLTSSAWRLHPVLSNTRSKCVLTVLGAIPSTTAMSDGACPSAISARPHTGTLAAGRAGPLRGSTDPIRKAIATRTSEHRGVRRQVPLRTV
jgi:hypothetical protein